MFIDRTLLLCIFITFACDYSGSLVDPFQSFCYLPQASAIISHQSYCTPTSGRTKTILLILTTEQRMKHFIYLPLYVILSIYLSIYLSIPSSRRLVCWLCVVVIIIEMLALVGGFFLLLLAVYLYLIIDIYNCISKCRYKKGE